MATGGGSPRDRWDRTRLKAVRRAGRNLIGRAGLGRKTTFVDRKKRDDRLACRRKAEDE